MLAALLPNKLWEIVEPFIPTPKANEAVTKLESSVIGCGCTPVEPQHVAVSKEEIRVS